MTVMETLDLNEAALFLKINPEVLRRKAKSKQVPGKKVGKRWVFVKEHLADWVSDRYPASARNMQVVDGYTSKENIPCQSTSEKTHGGFNSPRRTEREYNDLLALKSSKKHKNCTTD
ncbi:helix-turn-helix domain-containing protein [Methylomonas methanica]|uniref:helix-turn-helix domain-containing protein n=1 Tax=Methylomonas methanica TaxID=421 RepID=UPI0012F6314C